MSHDLLPGVTSTQVKTPRLTMNVLECGPAHGEPVVFVHGNISTGRFFEENMRALPSRYRSIAPTLRGFGDTEARPIDATRGLRDFSDDLHSLFETLNLFNTTGKVHLVGWSVGGAVIQQYAIDHAAKVASLTLIDPMSPFGFGGTRDVKGTPTFSDFAGSGGGTANPDFVKALAAKDTGTGSPNSPRNIVRAFFKKAEIELNAAREDLYVDEINKTHIGDDFYPGNMTTSPNWPTVAPGDKGMNNAISARYCDVSAFARISNHPPVLWIRGDSDLIVSDTSFFDFGFLGQLGYVPGWPGAEVYPPQPMVSQIRGVLDAYKANGGSYTEVVVEGCGHSPHLEHPAVFNAHLARFLS